MTGTSYNTRAKTKRGHSTGGTSNFVASLDIGYVYDTNNVLISRTTTAYVDGVAQTPVTTHFIVDAQGNMTLAFTGSTLTDRYLYGPGSGELSRTALDQILADEQLSTGNTYFAATDNQGTVRDLLEYDSETSTTSVESHLAYTPFGDLDRPDSTGLDVATVNFLFGYIGTWTDPATGLQYHSDPATGIAGRWLDPVAQRWLSPDPTGLLFGPNPYEDVNNSPTNGIDPSGLCDGDNPGGMNPGSVLPSAPGNTLTAAYLEYLRLSTQKQAAAREEFIRNGGDIRASASGYWSHVGQTAKGFFWSGPIGVVEGLGHSALHPIDTSVALAHAVIHPINTAHAIGHSLEQMSQTSEGAGRTRVQRRHNYIDRRGTGRDGGRAAGGGGRGGQRGRSGAHRGGGLERRPRHRSGQRGASLRVGRRGQRGAGGSGRG